MRGNKVDADLLKELTPGVSSKANITAVIGSPTARATFDDNTWIYISEVTQPRIGRTSGELQQHVVVLNFDQGGVLNGAEAGQGGFAAGERGGAHHPSPGTEASFMQQLLGNIGRFNPTGGNTGGGVGGGAPGAPQ